MQRSQGDVGSLGEKARFIVLTGLSGAGKSAAIRGLEDLGYFCVDNLPVGLISSLADLVEKKSDQLREVAVVIDLRDPAFLQSFPSALDKLRSRKNLGTVLIFLEANDAALIRRFSETRRPHPVGSSSPLLEGILKERQWLKPIRGLSDEIFDTSELTVHQLRRQFMDLSRERLSKELIVTLISFGYKYGVPLEADLLLDVRFLPNPYFVPELRALTGRNREVQKHINSAPAAKTFLEKTTDLLRFLIPEYADEGKSYVTIGIGCTGGRHRSVMMIERIHRRLVRLTGVRFKIKHRDILLENSSGGEIARH